MYFNEKHVMHIRLSQEYLYKSLPFSHIPTESSQGPPLQKKSLKRPPACLTAYFSIFCDILRISIFLINKCGFQRCVGRSWNLGINTCYYIVAHPWHLKFIDWLMVSYLFYLLTYCCCGCKFASWPVFES